MSPPQTGTLANGQRAPPSDSETLLLHLAMEAPEHFGGEDVDGLFGVDRALAKWDDPRAINPEALARIVLRASGLDDANREQKATDVASGRRANKAHPVDPAVSAAKGRAASMFNLVLSALDLRGDAHESAFAVLFDQMPAAGVAPDVVSYALAAAACAAATDDAGFAAVLASARRAAGVDARGRSKKAADSQEATATKPHALRVVWEDSSIAAVSKPAGVLMHDTAKPTAFKKNSTNVKNSKTRRSLVDSLVDAYGLNGLSRVNGVDGAGVVHRLDKPTSGIVLIAKTDEAHLLLVSRWFQRRVKKTYVALVEGHPGERDARRTQTPRRSSGSVEAFADGKPARSAWRVLETFSVHEGVGKKDKNASWSCSLVEVRPHTGRKHQIRQHMGLCLDAPLVGDPLYRKGKPNRAPPCVERFLLVENSPDPNAPRRKKKNPPGSVLFLHSKSIEFEHPINGQAMVLEDQPPAAFEAAVEALRKQSARSKGVP